MNNQSKIVMDIDRLVIEIATCNDMEEAEYYKELARYLGSLAERRIAALQVSGYGVFLGGRFMKQFPDIEDAHGYCVDKIIAIHDCEIKEIDWDMVFPEYGCIRRYWIGNRPLFLGSLFGQEMAEIWTVDKNNERIYSIHFASEPIMPSDKIVICYRTKDVALNELRNLVNTNQFLHHGIGMMQIQLGKVWIEIDMILRTHKSKGLGIALRSWLKENKLYQYFWKEHLAN